MSAATANWPRGLVTARHAVARLAAHEAVLLAYLGVAFSSLLVFGHGAGRSAYLARLALDAAALLGVAWASRKAAWPSPTTRASLRRLVVALVLVDTYLMLRGLLPLLRPDTVDARLHALDLALFRVEPSLWLERYATEAAVEWFAAAYLGHYALCAAAMVSFVAFPASAVTRRLALGVTLIFCIGQLGYMIVPATGPFDHLVGAFRGPLQGRFFWDALLRLVYRAGAIKDVFPSLHTAVSVWATLFVWSLARTRLACFAAASVTFLALNIVASTLLLRWHYGVDVIAGAVLGGLAFAIARASGGRATDPKCPREERNRW